MLKNYIKIALRHFGRHKLFTIINIAGLSVGITAALVIYLIVHFNFTFNKAYPDGDRIYRVVTDFTFTGERTVNGGVTNALPEAVKREVSGLQQVVPFETMGAEVMVPKGQQVLQKFKEQTNIIYADQRYFDLFPYKWLAGSATHAPYQVVLTSEQAKIYFPALSFNQMLGRQVVYNDTLKTTVTGIVQTRPENTDLAFHDFISFATLNHDGNFREAVKSWGSTGSDSQLYVKLAPGISVKNIELQLNALLKKYNPPKAEDKGSTQLFKLQPLDDIHFNSEYAVYETPAANKNMLYGLMAIAAFLLLLGCINFINLSTAQAAQRAKEIGIRKTMGSTQVQLIGQYLTETFMVTLFATLMAVLLAPLMIKLFADFIPAGVKADYLHQPYILGFLLVLAIVISLLSGFYPAMVLSGYKAVLVLKNQAYSGTGKTRNTWLRKSLIISQFVIAQFFIMATLLVSKQIYFALHKDLGFKKEGLVYFNTSFKDVSINHRELLLNKIRNLPGVELAALGGNPPSSSNTSTRTVSYKDGKKEITSEMNLKPGDENYIRIYKIKLLAGRNVRLADTASGMLVNATYAHTLGFNNPSRAVGTFVDFEAKHKRQIVGVVADFYQSSLHTAVKPLAIYPARHSGIIHMALKPQTPTGNEWKRTLAAVQQAWKEVYPDDDFDYHFYDESIAKFYESEQRISKLLSWATGMSIFISCLGLLGLAMYTTNLRIKEIGVRKVLGASVTSIITLLSSELVLLVLLAFVLVSPLAWWAMHAWMQNFAVRTTISWWIFALSGAGMLLAALLTISMQTIKAAVANPVKSLRSE